MILKKDIGLTAWLFHNKVDFKCNTSTITIDETDLPEDMLMKLKVHEYVKKVNRPKTKPSAKAIEKSKRQDRNREFIETMEEVGITFISYESYKKRIVSKAFQETISKKTELSKLDMDKIRKFAAKASAEPYKEPERFERPKAEYSNTQWNK